MMFMCVLTVLGWTKEKIQASPTLRKFADMCSTFTEEETERVLQTILSGELNTDELPQNLNQWKNQKRYLFDTVKQTEFMLRSENKKTKEVRNKTSMSYIVLQSLIIR